MKALLLTGENQYGVASHFLDGMRRDLSLMGISSQMLSLATQTDIHHTLKALDAGIEFDFVVSFNGVGLDIGKAEGNPFFELCAQPVYVFLVDHPLHRLHLLMGTTATILCVDQEHVSFCQLCGLKAAYFPHAVAAEDVHTESFVPVEGKTDEVLFPVSYFDEQHWRAKLEPIWGQIGKLVDSVNNVTRFLQLLGVLPLGERAATVPLDKNVLSIARIVDYYFRSRTRNACLELCAAHGVKLTVVGKYAQSFTKTSAFHDYEDALPFSDLLTRMAKSRFVLHNSPGFERGLHERIVVPMSLGTLVIPIDTPFAKQTFPPPCLFPDLATLGQITETDYNEAQRHNAQAVAAKHTWEARFTQLFADQGLTSV